jgi:2-oxo-4-hydroxy-4-carboxy--5-ureidoimidazoline (OHCU) decarboxylase
MCPSWRRGTRRSSTWVPEPVRLAPARALESMTADELAEAIRPLWEDAGPLVPRLVGRRFGSWDGLVTAVEQELAAAPDDFRTEVLRAHPRLGEDPAVLERRSRLSWAEQGGNRSADVETARRLQDLNDRYEARFGFPFVEWVAGRPLSAITRVIEDRLGNDRPTEMDKGSAALVAIARDRLRLIEVEEATQ